MKKIQTAVYYFPNYHVDPRNEAIHGTGWTEWELMKLARPRFEGHDQPKVPAWGYEDEADPQVMAKKIDVAVEHGVDAFVFDWYWYEGPYLERCLKEGFLGAPNNDKMKFALMWANHDWKNFHPGGRDTKNYPINFPWSVRRETVGFVWDYIIENFMTKPNYWRVGGLPYFSIYAVNRFIGQMGGVEATAEVLADFRAKAVKAGLPGIHIGGIWFDVLDSHPVYSECPQADWANKLGFSSYTSYNNCCTTDEWFRDFPNIDYDKAAEEYYQIARKAMTTLPAPYHPVVTAGWDSTPRCIQSEVYDKKPGYPYLDVMQPTPEKFGNAVAETVKILKQYAADDPIFFINAWNEWTEGSYLEPDTRFGMAVLEALKKELSLQ
ncbi:MAG: glycoside hydrolase family 99-like domain-containing protein [Lentisphaeria bacterium]|nr:glycoside hydrolase family 99-like domain-containing protein [Lentisphaeria bacterium]